MIQFFQKKHLEKIFNNEIFIEFCIKSGKVFILQCRPLLKNINNKNLDSVIVNLEKKFKNINQKNGNSFWKKYYFIKHVRLESS